MLKNITKLEQEVDGKSYIFLCDNESPLSVVKEVLQAFHSHCDALEKAILDERQKPIEEVKEE